MAEFLSSEALCPFPYASHIGLVGRLLSMEGESLGIQSKWDTTNKKTTERNTTSPFSSP